MSQWLAHAALALRCRIEAAQDDDSPSLVDTSNASPCADISSSIVPGAEAISAPPTILLRMVHETAQESCRTSMRKL